MQTTDSFTYKLQAYSEMLIEGGVESCEMTFQDLIFDTTERKLSADRVLGY
jgi:hypothetical protein